MSWHDRAFDDTAAKVMGIAFDAVCEKMDGLAYSDVVKEIIAKRIIEVASKTRAADKNGSSTKRSRASRQGPIWPDRASAPVVGASPVGPNWRGSQTVIFGLGALAFPSAGFNRGRSFRFPSMPHTRPAAPPWPHRAIGHIRSSCA
jgi:hypothetical protein